MFTWKHQSVHKASLHVVQDFISVEVNPPVEQINTSWWKASGQEFPGGWTGLRLNYTWWYKDYMACISCYEFRPDCIYLVFKGKRGCLLSTVGVGVL